MKMKKIDMKTRLVMLVLGMISLGSSIGISMILRLGTDPYSTLQIGVGRVLNLEFGAVSLIANSTILLFIIWKRRDLLGIGTAITLFGTGYIAQFFNSIFASFVDTNSLIQLVFFKALALTLMGLAIALMYVANLGLSAYGSLNVALTEATNGKVSFRWIRMANDLVFVLIGFSLGATVGVGTFLSAFAVGPITNFFMDKLSMKFFGQKVVEKVDLVQKAA
jgi:uncharacterized membrane protein YczE